jgi:hypothetical protein
VDHRIVFTLFIQLEVLAEDTLFVAPVVNESFTYYFLFYFRSLIIATFVNVSDVIDVSDNENDETEKAAIARATKNFRSQCWKEFEPVLEDGVVVQARCKHCDELMGARRGQGTSALLNHLKRCKKCSSALKIVQDLSSTLRSPSGRRLND